MMSCSVLTRCVLNLTFLAITVNVMSAAPIPNKLPKPERQYMTKDKCYHTQETLKLVESCPDKETFQKTSREKMCEKFPQCKGESLIYHCVRYKNSLAEVCSPKGNITGNCCALFDSRLGRVVEDYDKPCSECPFKYYSNESFLYPTCAELLNNRKKSKPITPAKTLDAKSFLTSTKQQETMSTTSNLRYSETLDKLLKKPWSTTPNIIYSDDSTRNKKFESNQKGIPDRILDFAPSTKEENNFPPFLIGLFIALLALDVLVACASRMSDRRTEDHRN